MTPQTDIAVIVVSYNTRAMLQACLGSIYAQADVVPEVWVVDNASSDGSPDMVRSEFP